MPRKAFDFPKYIITKNKIQRECKLCHHQFFGSGTRVKAHLYGIRDEGVKPCSKSEQFLEELNESKEGTKSTKRKRVHSSSKKARRSKKAKNIAREREKGLQDLDLPINHNTLNEDKKVDKETVEDLPFQIVSLKKETIAKELLPINEAEKPRYQVGPFSISHPVEADDLKLIKYVFESSKLHPREPVVSIGNSFVPRHEFCTLEPGTWLNSGVIDIVVEILNERKKLTKLLNWYLPIPFSDYALTDKQTFEGYVERQNIKETYMSKLADCEKMFIPILSNRHFYLCVIDMKKAEVRIWDSFPELSSTDIKERKDRGKDILRALDSLFSNDIENSFHQGWKFADFAVTMAEDIPCQPNGYDCGIFIIKFMKSAADITNLNTEFQSDEERLTIALSLLKDDMNTKKERLFQESRKPCQQDDEEDECEGNYHANALPSIPKELELQGIGDLNDGLKNGELLSTKENRTGKRSEQARLGQKILRSDEKNKYVEQRNNQILGMEDEAKTVAEEIAESSTSTGWSANTLMSKESLDVLIDKYLELEQYFIYSAFYPENKEISREELIRYFGDEGLIDGMKSLEAQFAEGHTILDQLENQGLLEGGSFDMKEQYIEDEYDKDDIWLKGGIVDPEVKWVKMSGDSKAKAIGIMERHSGYMVEAGLGLTQLPYDRQWSSMRKVSLMFNSIEKIPRGDPLQCPKLSTLILRQNSFHEISDNFFSDMPALQILDLSYTFIRSLPDSISNLESLNTLLLKSCRKLDYVPPLGNLKRLRRLDLSQTAIMKVPEGLETLVDLIWLSFFQCKKLDMKPKRLFPKLTNLRYLVLDYGNHWFMKVNAKDLEGLKKLETFAGNLCSTSDFNTYVESIQDDDLRPKNYLLQLGSGNPWDPTFGRAVIFINCDILKGTKILLPVDVEQLYVAQCKRWQCICADFSSNNTTSLKYIEIFECDGLEDLFCFADSTCNFCRSLQYLESLKLSCLQKLKFLWREIKDPTFVTLSGLRHLKVAECDSIRKLFTHQMLEKLPNLEKIVVNDCYSMVEIFSVTGREEMGESSSGGNSLPPTFCFPNLVSMELSNLPILKSVCGGKMIFKRMQQFIIDRCPELDSRPCTEPFVEINFLF